MNVLRFSLPRVFSISWNNCVSMVMLTLCFMHVASLHCVYVVYRKALLALLNQIHKEATNMKTLRVSDDAHQKLTAMLGEITAQTMKMQTYTDAIESLLSQSVVLSPALLNETEAFIEANRHLGYTTREELIRDASEVNSVC